MKAKEVIATTLEAMRTEATRTVDPHTSNIEAVITKIVDLVASLPERINAELHVEVTPSGAKKAK